MPVRIHLKDFEFLQTLYAVKKGITHGGIPAPIFGKYLLRIPGHCYYG